MRKAHSSALSRFGSTLSIRKSGSTTDASSRPPATACSWSLRASWMRYAVLPRSSEPWSTAKPRRRTNARIKFRVGINLGDIIADGSDIFGDSVNLAARLEALAEPGGICISRVVRDQIRGKLPYDFEDMGEQSVKNIARAVRAYALNAVGVASLPSVFTPRRQRSTRQRPKPQPEIPRLSIVVLPFANLSDDPEQQYFAEAIADDLTTDLSRISGSFVIARNTAFTYKGRSVDVRQIGRELGVRYVLEGSVRR